MPTLTVLPASALTSAAASAIQPVKTMGTVNVTNSAGRSLSVRDNMRLYKGYHVETKAKSYAWINLDSTKLTKLDDARKDLEDAPRPGRERPEARPGNRPGSAGTG